MSVYKRLNWAPGELLSSTKLNDMIANADYLFQNQINGYYDVLGLVRDSGLTIRAGYAKGLTTEAGGYGLDVYYSRPFLPGVRPVVLANLCFGHGDAMKIIFAIQGLNGSAIPDHTGFQIWTTQFRDAGGPTKFTPGQYFSYIAIGNSG